jgi:type I restriction enzyme M protein
MKHALEEIEFHNYVLTPGRYVGSAAIDDDGTDFEQKFSLLHTTLIEQFKRAEELNSLIRSTLDCVVING